MNLQESHDEAMACAQIEYDMVSSEYAAYIMAHSDRPICNGDMLTEAMEEGYLFDEFIKGK